MVKVFYWKDIKYIHGDIVPTSENFREDYAEVTRFPGNPGAEEIFGFLNSENQDYAINQETLKKLGIHHTSMSVGDVLCYDYPRKWLIAESVGFKDITEK